MLAFYWVFIYYKYKILQKVLQTIMLARLFLYKLDGQYRNKEVNYSRHYMLAFPVFMVVLSEEKYLSIQDEYLS